MKICTKCKIGKDESEFRNRKDKGWVCSICKECEKIYNKIYFKQNKEILLSKLKEYNEKNPHLQVKARVKYYKNNINKVRARGKLWKRSNSERIKESDWYIKALLKDSNFPKELINDPNLIETKRILLKWKRQIKEVTN